jgi:hypothetical protein
MLKSSLLACRVIIIKEMSHVLTWEELHRLSLVPQNSKRENENVEIKQQNRLEPPLSLLSVVTNTTILLSAASHSSATISIDTETAMIGIGL